MILFYSDPHFGLQRKANFTQESNERLEQYRKSLILDHLNIYDHAVCLGDFFDKTSNPESVLLDSLEIAEKTNFILAGNHDVSNRTSQKSTLEVLDRIYQCKVIMPPEIQFESIDGVYFYFIPHQLTQEEFENKLKEAYELEAVNEYEKRFLCLHCNYEMPFDATADTLNLTRDAAETLLEKFDYILLGHEHKPREDFNGRLKVIGNPFPTSFAEAHDHRLLAYDPENDTFTDIVTADGSEFFDGNSSEVESSEALFYTLTDDDGKAHKKAVELLKTAYAVRINSITTDKVEANKDEIVFKSLKETILEKLPENLKPVFEEMIKETTEEN